jgi:predicted HTH transcriptional regulator
MPKTRLFISSVQAEFTVERQMLFDYLMSDPLLGKFFEPFLFERLPAIDQKTDALYLTEVQQCDIYLGLLGTQYGFEDEAGISPTEREFDHATAHHKTRFIFLTSHNHEERHAKENAFIQKAQQVLIRKRFATMDELKTSVYATLVNYLIEKEVIRTGPFDATTQPSATLEDIDENKVREFVQAARAKRGFRLQDSAPIEEILVHLNLLKDTKLTHASLLLFGKEPQRFFINSEVRCVYFHGTIVEKPIPSYKVFKGDVFELVDQAVDFVLSKLDYSVGTRAETIAIPGTYEIPKEIVAEAIVNAIAHRDYTNNGSVQVMLFSDRLEVVNPGALPLGWSIEKLKGLHTSVPANPLLAEPMYLKGYIERLGTGTADMIRIAKEHKLQEPDFEQSDDFKTILYRPNIHQASIKHPSSTHQVPTKLPSTSHQVPVEYLPTSVEVRNLLKVVQGEMSRQELQEALGLKDRVNFKENYLDPAVQAHLIVMKFPASPNHPKQKYLLTEQGNTLKNQLN